MQSIVSPRFDEDVLLSFLLVQNIDTLHKLRLLLFLHEHQCLRGTVYDIDQRLFLGDTLLLQRIITELIKVGLVLYDDDCYTLSPDLSLRSHLDYLAQAYADPLTRQELLTYFNDDTPVTVMAKRVLRNY